MRLFLLVLIFLALLVNCSPEDSSVKSAIEQDFDRSRTIIHTTVIWHDTQGQVDKVFLNHSEIKSRDVQHSPFGQKRAMIRGVRYTHYRPPPQSIWKQSLV